MPFSLGTPVFIGIPREQMKGEGFAYSIFYKTDTGKMPTYGTKVPCEEHICALPEAIIQKGKARALILIPDRGNSFQCLQNWKETKRRQIS